ncbi:unnamed protein product, partial [marine sediment metagenome]
MAVTVQCSRCKQITVFKDGSRLAGRRCAYCGGALKAVAVDGPAKGGAPQDAQPDTTWALGRTVRQNLRLWFAGIAGLALIVAVCVIIVVFSVKGSSGSAERRGKLVRTEAEETALQASQPEEGLASRPTTPRSAVRLSPAPGAAIAAPEAEEDSPRRAYPVGPLPPDLSEKMWSIMMAFTRSAVDLEHTGARSVRANATIDVTVDGERYTGIAYRSFVAVVSEPGQLSINEFYVATTNEWKLAEDIVLPPETYVEFVKN